MFLYLAMNLVFLTSLLFLPRRVRRSPKRLFWITMGVMIVLTAIFDPIIIGLGIVDYDPTKILGIRLFGAPIEDFFYAVYAVLLVPALWRLFGEKKTDAAKN